MHVRTGVYILENLPHQRGEYQLMAFKGKNMIKGKRKRDKL
jgi:hypothetical protein